MLAVFIPGPFEFFVIVGTLLGLIGTAAVIVLFVWLVTRQQKP